MSQVLALRELLEQRFPDAVPVGPGTAGAVGTGVESLDRVLPGGGLPRGRLSAWAPGGGATAVLRSACAAVAMSGERSAWVDGTGLLLEHSLSSPSPYGRGALLLRPRGELAALECAEELLRSGGFALVVVTGAAETATERGVRLSRAAKDGGGALVLVAESLPVAALRLRSRIGPDGCRWRRGPFGEPVEVEAVRVHVDASALGWSGGAHFALPVLDHEHRLSVDPRLVDRRGAGRAAGSAIGA